MTGLTSKTMVAVDVATAVVDLHAREHLSERLAWAHADTIAGGRLDIVADDLAEIARDARAMANVTAPCREHPRVPVRCRRPAWPATTRPPQVPTRRERLQTRAEVLVAAGVDVGGHRRAVGMAPLAELESIGLDRYEALLLDLEVEHLDTGRPFNNHRETAAA